MDASSHRVERCEECAAVLGQHEPCSYTDCPHAIPKRVEGNALELSEHWLATRNREAEIRADERHRIAAEIDRLEPRYPNLVSRVAIRKLLNV